MLFRSVEVKEEKEVKVKIEADDDVGLPIRLKREFEAVKEEDSDVELVRDIIAHELDKDPKAFKDDEDFFSMGLANILVNCVRIIDPLSVLGHCVPISLTIIASLYTRAYAGENWFPFLIFGQTIFLIPSLDMSAAYLDGTMIIPRDGLSAPNTNASST